MDIRLRIIPEPDPKNASILRYAGQKGFFKSFVNGLTGSDNYVCGNCGAILCEHIDRGPTLKIGNIKLESDYGTGRCFPVSLLRQL